jgi:hypothetical protein
MCNQNGIFAQKHTKRNEKKNRKKISTMGILGLVILVLCIIVNYINKKTVEQISMYYYGEGVNIMIYCYIRKKKVNVVTCDYKSQCSHM